jgi:glycyl-tRNA synthetase
LPIEKVQEILKEKKLFCPKCGKSDFTAPRHFNLMFSTSMNKVENEKQNIAYLRPETAQAIFIEYKNILDTVRVRIPFGVAQIGKAFRNEITPGNFIFRLVEFEQMEIEYFIQEKNWEEEFSTWLKRMHEWCSFIGLPSSHIHEEEHSKEKLSHYSKRTVDITYDFPFGTSELYGLAYRTDFDLKNHAKHSHTNMDYIDPITKERYIPHVIEPTFGLDRTLLALFCSSYAEETLENGEKRVVLRFLPRIAPVKAAIFPLMKKEGLSEKAKEIFQNLHSIWNVEYDDSGAIGKRYRRQDEIGTPYCITVDFDTLEDNTVTFRDRDTMEQIRIPIDQIQSKLHALLS